MTPDIKAFATQFDDRSWIPVIQQEKNDSKKLSSDLPMGASNLRVSILIYIHHKHTYTHFLTNTHTHIHTLTHALNIPHTLSLTHTRRKDAFRWHTVPAQSQ